MLIRVNLGLFFLSILIDSYFILFPNGVSPICANLKCCMPNGIPIIVMHKNIPKTRWVSAIHIPPNKIQIIFMITDKQPLA